MSVNGSLYDVTCLFAATSRFVPAASVSKVLPQLAKRVTNFGALRVAIKHFFR